MAKGFASMSPERRKEIAKRGAKRLHDLKRAHQYDSTTGAQAAQKRHAVDSNKPLDRKARTGV